jgi:septum formation protein
MSSMDSAGRSIFRNLEPLILASGSPRRKDLLQSVGLTFEVVASGVEETGGSAGSPDSLVKRWAEEKARAVSGARPDCWVLAADTIVVLGERIFGKPDGPEEASAMLRDLSGRAHQVVSGLCLAHGGKGVLRVDSVTTRVHFKPLAEAEIAAYIHTGEPMDKAGAYGIQGMGAFLVRSVQGSYTSVVGLPLCETLEWLLQERVITPAVQGTKHGKS